jgi:glycosyltransferase involved in cell wall biosynthesis
MPIRSVPQILRRFVADEWGGTESVVYNIAAQLEARGVRSPIITTDFLSVPGEERLGDVQVRRFKSLLPWLGLSQQARHSLQLKGGSPLSFKLFQHLLCAPEVDVIHTHALNRLGGIARTAARLRGIPYVVTVHGGFTTLSAEQGQQMRDPTEGKLEWGKAFGLLLGSRRVLEDADAIVAVGCDEYQGLKQRYPEKEVLYLPNGVDPLRFEHSEGHLFRQQAGIAKDAPLLLCVSRIDPQKNQALLLRAFKRYLHYESQAILALIGPETVASYGDELRAYVKAHGLSEQVRIVGGMNYDDPCLASAFRAADVFILPSKMEPFGIVILEAWAAGTPVIASKVGGIPGFTQHDKNILHFGTEKEDDLIAQLLRLQRSPQLREELRRGGKDSVQFYTWARLSSRLLDVYEGLRCSAKHSRGTVPRER